MSVLSNKETQKIVKSFLKNKRNIRKTAKELKHHPKTIRKYVVMNRFKVRENHNYGDNPLDYYLNNFETFAGLTRSDLHDRYPGLYYALKRQDQLDLLIPSLTDTYRGFDSPLDYFNAHRDRYKGMGRGKLHTSDSGLYDSLLHHEQLDEAIPERYKRFRGFDNPLDYFIAHIDEYESMNRDQLSNADPSLYRSLLRREQLDKAIPDYDKKKSESGRMGGRMKPLSDFEIQKIISCYETYNRNPNEAARHIHYGVWRIRRTWHEAGLETIGRGNAIPKPIGKRLYRY